MVGVLDLETTTSSFPHAESHPASTRPVRPVETAVVVERALTLYLNAQEIVTI